MGRFILSLAIAYMVAAGMGLSKAHSAEPQCGERGEVHKKLARKFKEAPAAVGVTSTGSLVEVLTSKSGSWTIVINMTDGSTCLIAAGEGWREMEQVSTDPEA